jgi:hypothetical protein
MSAFVLSAFILEPLISFPIQAAHIMGSAARITLEMSHTSREAISTQMLEDQQEVMVAVMDSSHTNADASKG